MPASSVGQTPTASSGPEWGKRGTAAWCAGGVPADSEPAFATARTGQVYRAAVGAKRGPKNPGRDGVCEQDNTCINVGGAGNSVNLRCGKPGPRPVAVPSRSSQT